MIYRLTHLGEMTVGGVNGAVDAQVRGIAKSNAHHPYTIANELVAMRLGQALGLPVPTGIIGDYGGTAYFLSLDVSKEGRALPPAFPEDFFNADPLIAAGALAFDIFIANPDRHQGNLAIDIGFTPPRLSLFDHGHALLGSYPPPIGVARLESLREDLACTGQPQGNRQVFLDHVVNDAHLFAWVTRIEELPDFLIENACLEASNAPISLTPSDAGGLARELLGRRDRLRTLIWSHQGDFSVDRWGVEWGASSDA